MLKSILTKVDILYTSVKNIWESAFSLRLISSLLVWIFLICALLSFLSINGFIHLGSFNSQFQNPFFSIEVVFTILLISELFGLIFILPRSVARSVGKQFELLSLIFLRDGFKEFSHIKSNYTWESLQEPLTNMVVYGFGAIAIFMILGIISRLQKHIKLSNTEDDIAQFVRLKKLLSLLLLVAFTIVGFLDLKTLVETGKYLHSFKTFYTVLIFSDILIVLFALRYTFNYYKLFRYSAFVLATIMIRIALSAEACYDVLIGLMAVVFVLLLTFAYNYFLEENRKSFKF